MKKIIVGGILLFSGVILYLGVFIPAARLASTLGGWTTPPGRLGTALNETGGSTAYHSSIVMIICGILLLLWGCFGEEVTGLIVRVRKIKNENEHEPTINQDEPLN
ncbi:hypothetical protein GZH47_25310 [Paenibacillus rhizovicinus]|uniref:Uncharacterized protein n=1 Tax=Paenibacillus rhizovicinus TaxID=2704463 RepID=A0A6C0P5J2_9BACL|nr:hypothetical protein [Paenibacillus rhizovicinus]QHW33788.1 hypothetical protein GZH47_25310 [Paenibacillus rhizovicinus]